MRAALYGIDYDVLSKGVIRYLRTITDECLFERNLQVDRCHDQDAMSGSKEHRDRMLSSKKLGEDVFFNEEIIRQFS